MGGIFNQGPKRRRLTDTQFMASHQTDCFYAMGPDFSYALDFAMQMKGYHQRNANKYWP
jgi:hypothetical protein